MNNATVDVNTVVLLYPESVNYQWKVTQTFYDNNKRIGGYTINLWFFGYRKKNTKSSHSSRQ